MDPRSLRTSPSARAAWAPCAFVLAWLPGVAAADEIVVTATRTPAPVSRTLAEVTVLDRAALERSEARTLAEVLAATPGLQYSVNGGLGKPASVFVRGLEARHLLLLVDGVRVGSATVDLPSIDNLPLEAIERIEIVRGPLSSLYGSGALGGVVQVFTRRASADAAGLRGNAKFGGGSHGYTLAAAGVGVATRGVDLAVQAQHQRNDGFSATNAKVPFGSFDPDADGWRQNGASVRAGWAFAQGWRADAMWLESRGRTQYDDGPGADARASIVNRVQSLQLDGRLAEGWHTRLAAGRALDVYDTLAAASPWATLGPIETDQRQLAWEHRVRLPRGEALLLAERVEQRVARSGEPFDVDERTIDALGAGWSGRHGAHEGQVSVRRDRNSQFGGHTTGTLAYAYRVAPAWRLGASAATSFNAPSFNQLYYPGFGNADLRPEQGRHQELFAQWRGGTHQLRATLYRHRYRSFMSAGPQPTNIPRVAIDGATLAWDAQVGALALAASADWVDARNATDDGADEGRRLPRRAPRAVKASADWQLGGWSLGASLQAYAARHDDAANTLHMGGYGVLDLRADWTLARDWVLGLRLNNVVDKAYETAYGYNQPGREWFATLRWAPR